MPFSLLGGCQVRAARPLAGLPAEPEWCLSATSRVSHSAGDTAVVTSQQGRAARRDLAMVEVNKHISTTSKMLRLQS